MDEHERLSKAVAAIIEFDNRIQVTQADTQVVGHSFANPASIRPSWTLAVAIACVLCPWLRDDDASNSDWSMNVFTSEGLWSFPA